MIVLPDKADNPNFVPLLKRRLDSLQSTVGQIATQLNGITSQLEELSVGGGSGATPSTSPSILSAPITTIVNNGKSTIGKNRLYGRDAGNRIILSQPTIPARYVSMSAASPGQQFKYAQMGIVYIHTNDESIDVTVNEGIAYAGDDGTVTAIVPATKVRPVGWFASGSIVSGMALVELAIIPWSLTRGISNL